MKRYIQLTFASLIAIIGISFAAPFALSAGAINPFSGIDCSGGGASGTDSTTSGGVGNSAAAAVDEGNKGGGSSTSLCGATKTDSAPDIIKNVINTILVVLGMITVVMIIIGGIRYTTSNGDASGIKGAKDTILYAIVGLVIAILSYAIVNFVLGRFSGN